MATADAHPTSLAFRVYASEGKIQTQDEAIVRQGQTLAAHDERLQHHGEQLATLTEATANHGESIASLTTLMKWGLGVMVTFSFTVAGSAVVFALSNVTP